MYKCGCIVTRKRLRKALAINFFSPLVSKQRCFEFSSLFFLRPYTSVYSRCFFSAFVREMIPRKKKKGAKEKANLLYPWSCRFQRKFDLYLLRRSQRASSSNIHTVQSVPVANLYGNRSHFDGQVLPACLTGSPK